MTPKKVFNAVSDTVEDVAPVTLPLIYRRLFFLFAFLMTTTSVRAAGPTITPLTGESLPRTFQAGQKYTIRMRYTDPKGDTIKKSDVKFVDESPSGAISTPVTDISGDTQSGATLVWNGLDFASGPHKGHFEVKGLTGSARYPIDPADQYEFAVEALGTKLGLMAAGLGFGLVAVPFLVYIIARKVNPRGNPSRTARVGLMLGVLACCVLFIYLFANVYGPLVYAILVIGLIATIVLGLSGK